MPTCLGESFVQYLITSELAVGDSLVNAREILINDSAGPQVQVAHLRVAHLSFRQADVCSTGAQLTARIFTIEFVVKWRVSEKRGIAIFFTLIAAARIDAPPITNDQHDRPSHMAALCRRLRVSTSCFTRLRDWQRNARAPRSAS